MEFGEKHIDDDKAVVGEQIRDQIFEFLPELPREFASVKYHKWKYSQVEPVRFLPECFFIFVWRSGHSTLCWSTRLRRSATTTAVDPLGRRFRF